MAFHLDSDERPYLYVLKMDTCPACEMYMKQIHNKLVDVLDNKVKIKVISWKNNVEIQQAPDNLRRYLQSVPSILLVQKEEPDGLTPIKAFKWNHLAVEPSEIADTGEFFTYLAKPFTVESISGFVLDNLENIFLI